MVVPFELQKISAARGDKQCCESTQSGFHIRQSMRKLTFGEYGVVTIMGYPLFKIRKLKHLEKVGEGNG